jgi:pimeloyl-ACP methyl ester carboxylesterase
MTSEAPSPQVGYAPVNGINMYYERYHGSGTPLVLLHGGGSTIETSFGNLIPELMKDHLLVAVELQAHGRTSDRDAPESFVQDADDVATLLRHLRINKANILGFSNGGTTTLQIAIRHPELVEKIIPVSAVYQREGIMAGFFDGMVQATLENMPQQLKDAFLKVNPDKEKLEIMFTKDKQRMLDFADIADQDIRSIKAGSLIISSDRDVVLPEHALKLSRTIEHASLVILPGVHGSTIGEVCVFESSGRLHQVTANIITDFLRSP